MSSSSPRKITTWFQLEETPAGDRDITVEVEQQDRFTATVCDNLDELGVPADEQDGVRARAIAAYWDAEHAAWLLTPEAEAAGQ